MCAFLPLQSVARASPLTLVLPLTLSLRLAPEARSLLELVCTLRPGNSPFPPILREATCSIPNTNQLAGRLLRVNELASTPPLEEDSPLPSTYPTTLLPSRVSACPVISSGYLRSCLPCRRR